MRKKHFFLYLGLIFLEICFGQSIFAMKMKTMGYDRGSLKRVGRNVRLPTNKTFSGKHPQIFKGNSTLNGNGKTLTVRKGGLVVDKNSTLHLRNITIKFCKGSSIVMRGNSSTLKLENVTWILSSNYEFTKGKFIVLNGTFHIKHTPFLMINGFTDPSSFFPRVTFHYRSSRRSVIEGESTFKLNNICFRYNPLGGKSDRIMLKNKNTTLCLKNSAIIHDVYMKLNEGKAKLSGWVFLSQPVKSLRKTLYLNNMFVFTSKKGCQLQNCTKLDFEGSVFYVNRNGYLHEATKSFFHQT